MQLLVKIPVLPLRLLGNAERDVKAAVAGMVESQVNVASKVALSIGVHFAWVLYSYSRHKEEAQKSPIGQQPPSKDRGHWKVCKGHFGDGFLGRWGESWGPQKILDGV